MFNHLGSPSLVTFRRDSPRLSRPTAEWQFKCRTSLSLRWRLDCHSVYGRQDDQGTAACTSGAACAMIAAGAQGLLALSHFLIDGVH